MREGRVARLCGRGRLAACETADRLLQGLTWSWTERRNEREMTMVTVLGRSAPVVLPGEL